MQIQSTSSVPGFSVPQFSVTHSMCKQKSDETCENSRIHKKIKIHTVFRTFSADYVNTFCHGSDCFASFKSPFVNVFIQPPPTIHTTQTLASPPRPSHRTTRFAEHLLEVIARVLEAPTSPLEHEPCPTLGLPAFHEVDVLPAHPLAIVQNFGENEIARGARVIIELAIRRYSHVCRCDSRCFRCCHRGCWANLGKPLCRRHLGTHCQ